MDDYEVVIGDLATTSGDTHIGRTPDSDNENFTGIIDDVRIYNRSFSETEIRNLMNPPEVCQDNNFCCDACDSDPHPEFDGDCPGQVCCGFCSGGACHDADTDESGVVETDEIIVYMQRWRVSIADVSMSEMMSAIAMWKAG